ncbi:TetR/AcrR family transcriptional regulator [Sciscionella marina]|uniref:TetR/AcrR family transcriptional regulator n=1 Tax=Sciscionella marina TaxID=508770 RepID=UPI00035E814C|nr:TetR family transcriptional regulator [Sciscionella marina]
MPRPKRQGERRSLIIEAAGRAVRERGLAEVRVRDIAAHAGLSPGSVLYYYPEIAELMLEVHSGAVADFYRARVERIGAEQEPGAKLRAAVRSGLPAGAEDAVARLLYEMHSLADRSAGHAALMSSLFDREVALYRSVLELGAGLGEFTLARPLEEIARNTVALEDGYGLHLISGNRSLSATEARAALLGYLAVMTARTDLLDQR